MPDPDGARPSGGGRGGGAPSIAVIGAGAFGGWLALWLCRRGARVTLVDAWGPGNSRSSSGGETRVLRAMYGRDRLYTEWTVRALDLWLEAEALSGRRLFHSTGALWLFSGDDSYARASLPCLAAAGWAAAELDPRGAAERFPQLSFAGVDSVFYEERAGYLAARRACRVVAAAVAAAGGEVREAAASPGAISGQGAGERRQMSPLPLSDGSRLAADLYVFACGPWLGQLFPGVMGPWLRVTRQEVFYFGAPPGSGTSLGETALPIWLDFGERMVYGIPGNDHRGMKVADDSRGDLFDPTGGERLPSAAALERARRHLAWRIPAMAGAPLLEARVCQYENTPDGQLLVDRHPEAGNVWLLGGGSGHGFKLAPALGEYAAGLILGGGDPRPELALARLASADDSAPISQYVGGARS